MNRAARRQLGNETVEILAKGAYQSASGKTVSLKSAVEACVAATRVIADGAPLPVQPPKGNYTTHIEVTTESSLQASKRLVDLYKSSETPSCHASSPVLCLSFASAHNPGGGFLGGSQAQEESLARNSALYASQTRAGADMYAFNGRLPKNDASKPHTLYSDYMILSPNVPVFRDEESGALLDEVYYVSMLSAPAPNAGATISNFVKRGAPEAQLWALIDETMERRLNRILAIAQDDGVQALVLGAYGCGVFRNRPAVVAGIFRKLLDGPFHNTFRHVVFAVHARDAHDPTFQVFQRILS